MEEFSNRPASNKPVQKKKITKKNLIIAALIFAVAAAVLLFAFRGTIMKHVNPKAYLAESLLRTKNAMTADTLKLPQIDALLDNPHKAAFTVSLKDYQSGTMDEITANNVSFAKMITVSGNSVVDPQNRKLKSKISLSRLVDLGLFFSDDLYYVRCDQIYDKAISFTPISFADDFNNSWYAKELNVQIPRWLSIKDDINDELFRADYTARHNEALRIKEEAAQKNMRFLIDEGKVSYANEDGTDVITVENDKGSLSSIRDFYADKINDNIFTKNFYAKLDRYGIPHDKLYDTDFGDLLKELAASDSTTKYYIHKGIIHRVVFTSGDVRIDVGLFGVNSAAAVDVMVTTKNRTILVRNDTNGSDKTHLADTFSLNISKDKVAELDLTFSVKWAKNDELAVTLGLTDADAPDGFTASLNGKLTEDEKGVKLENANLSAGLGVSESVTLRVGGSLAPSDEEISADTDVVPMYKLSILDYLEMGAKINKMLGSD